MTTKNKKNENTVNQNTEAYDAAVKFINERHESSKKGLLEIGEYLLEHFYGGDIDAVKEKRPGKILTLRELNKRDDAHMSLTNLWRGLYLAAQEKEIGAVPTSEQLTLSHKEVLLKVKDIDEKKRYMEIAVQEKLSVRQLGARLKDDGVNARSGAEEDPEKTVSLEHKRLEKAFDVISVFSPKLIKKMDVASAQAALNKAEDAQKGLTKVIEKLKEKAGVAVKKVA